MTCGGIKPELYESQVEAVTPVLTSLADAARSLVTSRASLARAAAAEGVAAVGVGTPVLAGPRPVLSTGDDRYRLVAGTYQGAFADYEACGCHVHVGVPGGDLAVAVVDHLRPWLPTLLALSANSPFHHGRDTGYASWRTIDQARFPGGGVPPRFGDFAGYERCLDQLVDCGVLVDERMTFWAARPSPRYATVEVRVADVAASPDGALLQAALVRGLVRAALDDLSHGREAPEVDGQLAMRRPVVGRPLRHPRARDRHDRQDVPSARPHPAGGPAAPGPPGAGGHRGRPGGRRAAASGAGRPAPPGNARPRPPVVSPPSSTSWRAC